MTFWQVWPVVVGGVVAATLTIGADWRVIDVEAEDLWADRLIWDLLYNGIRHSAARGAAVNDAARGWFELT